MEQPHIRSAPSQLDAESRARALAALSMEESERFATSSDATRESFLAGRWLLRTLVADVTGVIPEEVGITATCPDCGGPHGAPTVVGGGIFVSLTRAEDVIVAAASEHGRVGIDAEGEGQTNERLDAIAALTGKRSLRHWTSVEAVVKADGRGLRLDPRLVSITGDRGFIADTTASYDVRAVEIIPTLCVTVAVERA